MKKIEKKVNIIMCASVLTLIAGYPFDGTWIVSLFGIASIMLAIYGLFLASKYIPIP